MDCTALLTKAHECAEDVIKGIVAKQNLTPTDLENLTKAVCLIETIKTIGDIESGNSYGHSTRRYYDGKMSRRGGYSGHSLQDRMVAKLEEMYGEAQNDHEEKVITEWINRLKI